MLNRYGVPVFSFVSLYFPSVFSLQADFDTEEVERKLADELNKIHPWEMAA